MDLAAGTLVAGKYELERRIGSGGMGEVWSAVQRPTRKRVALKFLRPGKGDSDAEEEAATRKRFLREARAACAVQHPNVVEVHDVLSLDDGSPVMVMEYLQGETLEARLARDGRLPVGEVAAILARVVSAVGAAHALGIVHRDLKPDNVFLAETADGVDVKVLDFGIAKLTALEGDAAQTGGLTNTGAMLGTPFYMSPEQAFGEKQVDHRADIWSLGIILYRAISGVLPTRADNIGQILKIIMMGDLPPVESRAPGTPPELASLIGRMLQARREDRPQTLQEVRTVLERFAGVEVADFGPPATAPETAPGTTNPTVVEGGVSTAGVASGARRPPARRVWIAVAMAALGGAAAGAFTLRGRTSPDPTPTAATPTAAPAADGDEARTSTAPTNSRPAAAPTSSPEAAPPAASSSSSKAAGSSAPSASVPAPSGGRPPVAGRLPTAAPPAPSVAAPSSTGAPGGPSMGGVIASPPQF